MQRRAKGFGGVFEIGSARADLGARGAHGACRNEGIAAIEMKANPAESGANGAGTIRCDLERIRATQIDGDRRRSINNELAGRRPDGGVNGADVELKALVIWIGLQETDAGIGIDLNLA